MLWLTILCLVALGAAACEKERVTPVAPTSAATVLSPTHLSTFYASGTVVEIGGGPVADATVSVRSCDDTPSYNHIFGQSMTDTTGGFGLEVASGTQLPLGCVYLRVAKNGYVGVDLEWPRSTESLTIRMQRLREVTGRVVEVDGGPISGVAVSNGRSGPVAVSNASGFFVVNDVGTYMTLNKTGYVERSADVPEGQAVDVGTVHLQRAIVLSAGSRVTSRISSADVPYEFSDMWDQGYFCSPCKWIDLQTGQQDLAIQLRWSGDVQLTLWAATDYYGRLVVATAKPGESALTLSIPAATRVLLVGIRSETLAPQTVPQPVPFELTTTLR
jgi:hypothetical protein